MQRAVSDGPLQKHKALLEWIVQKGGHLHKSVKIAKDDKRGVYFEVKQDWGGSISKSTCIVRTPVSTTLSYLNVIDHKHGENTFSSNGIRFPQAFIDAVGPEESTIFFLMGQYLLGSGGFWFPFIHALPQPGTLTTPLYYEGSDLEWLDGTSLLPAREQRMGIMKDKYNGSYKKLCDSGIAHAERYTWDLYLWASTIITSRAFSSKVLSGAVSGVELPKDSISVLLPLLDILNHRPLAKVEWGAGREYVNFLILEDVSAGQEISNNYGPRNNEQLMMNYGFCLPDNICDYRILRLRVPPGSPLHQARSQQSKIYDKLAGEVDDRYYVFNIFYPLLAPGVSMEHSIFSPALLNAISVLAANNRELETLEINEEEIRIPSFYGNSRNLLAALSQVIIELITHIVRLKNTARDMQQPKNLKQVHGKMYRDSQITLSETALIIAAWTLLRARQHDISESWPGVENLLSAHMAYIPHGKFSEETRSRIRVRILEHKSLLADNGELFQFDELFGVLQPSIQRPCEEYFKAILAGTEKAIPMLKGSSKFTFGFPMFICLIIALFRAEPVSPGECQLPFRLSRWAGFLLDKYPPPQDDVSWVLEDEDDENIVGIFDSAFEEIRAQTPASLSILGGRGGDWLSPNWLRWGWMTVEQESVQVPDEPMRVLATSERDQEPEILSMIPYLYIPAS